MDKVWYILIDNAEEGPYSAKELLNDSRVTLETYVWKEGFDDWKPLKKVRELRRYFQSQEPKNQNEEEAEAVSIGSQSELALDYSPDPNLLFLVLIILMLLFCYIFFTSIK